MKRGEGGSVRGGEGRPVRSGGKDIGMLCGTEECERATAAEELGQGEG